MENLFSFILDGSGYSWLDAVSRLVMGANAITMLTPTKVDNKIMSGAGSVINMGLKVLNVVSLNIGANANKDTK